MNQMHIPVEAHAQAKALNQERLVGCGSLSKLFVLAVGVMLAGATFANAGPPWDGSVTGTISQIDTVANEVGNYEVRIYVGNVAMCTTSYPNSYAYLNSADNNFNATYASLMMAYATGKTVTILTLNDGGIGCHIHYVMNK